VKRSKRKKEPAAAADAAPAERPPEPWELVRDGVVDAALLMPPASLFAEAGGLKLIDIEPLPMIHFTTISSSLGFVEKHPDIVERFLKGLIEGIHFFKTKPHQAIKIIRECASKRGQMNLEQATITHRGLADILEPKLYPKMRSDRERLRGGDPTGQGCREDQSHGALGSALYSSPRRHGIRGRALRPARIERWRPRRARPCPRSWAWRGGIVSRRFDRGLGRHRLERVRR
jgi:hypothetical protein